MPKTSVDEDNKPMPRKCQIDFDSLHRVIFPIPETFCPHQSAKADFDARVLAAYFRHQATSLFRVYAVHPLQTEHLVYRPLVASVLRRQHAAIVRFLPSTLQSSGRVIATEIYNMVFVIVSYPNTWAEVL